MMYVCLSVCFVKSSAAGQHGQGASEPARSSVLPCFWRPGSESPTKSKS